MPRLPIHVFTGVFAGLLLLPCAQAQQPATATLPYMNPALPLDQRVDDLIGRMTLEEKVRRCAMARPRFRGWACPSTTGGTRGCTGWRFAGNATNFPQAIGMAATWDTAWCIAWRRRHLHRGARQVQPGAAGGRPRALLRAHLLGAEHQYLSRSALGPRAGDLRRRSLT